MSERSTSRGSSRPTSGRCSAKEKARSVGWCCPATRPTSQRPMPPFSTCSRRTSRSPGGSGSPASGCASRACPRGSAGSATANATAPESDSTRWSPPVRCKRRWLSDATTSTADRWPLRTGRPRRCRRFRRNRGLAAAQRARQHRVGCDVGLDPPWRRRRYRAVDQRRAGDGGRRHTACRGEDRPRADERSGDGRGPACRRRLRARVEHRRRARGSSADAGGAQVDA